MRKKVRESLLGRMSEKFGEKFEGGYALDDPHYADWLFVYPRPRASRFYLSQIICKEQEDACFVSVGWNTVPVADELASDTGAQFEREVHKSAGFLSLAALMPEVGQPVCIDDALANWYRTQREWYEAMNRGIKNAPLPPNPPAASPVAAVLAAVDLRVRMLLEAHAKAFARFDAELRSH